MNLAAYTQILYKNNNISDIQVRDIEKIVVAFPYFQSARAIHLRQLFLQNSFEYGNALKKTAVYTTNRSVLFDYITSEFTEEIKTLETQEDTINISQEIILEKSNDITSYETEIEPNKTEANSIEKSILSSIKESNQDDNYNKKTEEKVEIDKPKSLDLSEKHSFQEWLQLAKINPIIREESKNTENKLAAKLDAIDKFIAANPKIIPVKKDSEIQTIHIKTEDNSYLMTETLAKVYLDQKKYDKAIQAYEILILKYPKKISYFADRISEIKTLQNNYSNN